MAAIAIGGFIYTWLTSKASANKESIVKLTQTHENHAERILKIEPLVEGIPEIAKEVRANREEIGKIQAQITAIPEMRKEVGVVHRRIDDVAQTANNINGQLLQLNRSMSLIEQHLMTGDDK